VVENEDILDIALEHFELDTSDLLMADQLFDTIKNLTVLKDTVTQYGLSANLIAFVDQDNILSNSVENFPSLENYSSWADVDNTDSQNAALEGIISKISETAGRWYNAIAAHLVKYKKYYLTAVAIVAGLAISALGYKKYIDGKKIKEDADFSHAEKAAEMDKQNNMNMEKARVAAKSMGIEVPNIDTSKIVPKPTIANAKEVVDTAIGNVVSAKEKLERLKASLASAEAKFSGLKIKGRNIEGHEREAHFHEVYTVQSTIHFYTRMIHHAVQEAKLNRGIAATVAGQFH
jgi:hypothetical protein